MKAYIVFGILILLAVAAFGLGWMNRASEKIISTLIPIEIAAVTGVFLAVLVFGGEPLITEVFPAAFLYDKESKLPWAGPPWPAVRQFTHVLVLFAPANLQKVHPEFFNDASDAEGRMLYHHLLQRAIIDWMGLRYRKSWQIEDIRFELPTGSHERFGPPAGDTVDPVKLLRPDDIEKLLEGNKFAGIPTISQLQIALPPGMQILISAPPASSGDLDTGEILLHDNFCELSIQTQLIAWQPGVGAYQQLGGISDEENKHLATVTYRVNIKAEFSRWRSGHPRMAKYKAWVRQLGEGLKGQFSEEVIWSKTKEAFILWNQVEQLRRGPTRPLP